LVIENGGTEDEAIAALLHDAVEDQGGLATYNLIKTNFGDNVARIVEGCTDAYTHPKPPWKERKLSFLNKLESADKSIQLVSLADKFHNASSILSDLRSGDQHVWEKFKGGKDGTRWYYQSLAEIFNQSSTHRLVKEFCLLVDEILNHSDQGRDQQI
jgi:(p)ppGpp synthase/HD superfamily hydrolase